MYKESSLSLEEKKQIAFQIKPISITKAQIDYNNLKEIDDLKNITDRCRIGNDCVDYFSFVERLNTKGKYNINFYDFIENIEEFKKKKFIQNMILYYETTKNKNNKKNKWVVYKEIYNICISAINIFRPIIAMEIYQKFQPKSILDFTCGWGGRLLGACALNIPKYIGIDINKNLEQAYHEMKHFLNKQNNCKTEIQLFFNDALNIDYTKLDYDMVFTSPPYFFLEKYSFNTKYNSKEEMINTFYIPLFQKTFESLKKGGYYCLNINKEIYEIAITIFGLPIEEIPLKKSKRQNNYKEFIYVWRKSI